MGTVSIVFREDKLNKKGLAPVAIKIYDSVTGKRKQEFTGVRISPQHWDNKNQKVATSHPNSTRMNKVISQKFHAANDRLLELEQRVDRENPFEDSFDDGGQLGFLNQGNLLLEQLGKSDKDYSKAHRVKSGLVNLRLFLRYLKTEEAKAAGGKPKTNWRKRNDFVFSDFSMAFVKDFAAFVLNERGLQPVTLSSHLIGIRKVFKFAIERELVDEKWFRFRDFSISGKSSKVVFCKEDQLQALADLELEPGSEAELFRDVYLFTAYGGGFRWGDIARMKWGRIEGNEIYFKSGKSQTDIAFVLPDLALRILDKYRKKDVKPSDFVFPILNPDRMATASPKVQRFHVADCNVKVNRHLKQFEKKIGLGWRMSFHSSRHTFATMAIRNGMPVETLRVILGHSDINITMIYVHITGEQVRAEMAKFNRRLNEKAKGRQVAVQAAASLPASSSMGDFVRRFVEATAAEMGVEVVGIDGLALEMYEVMQRLPKEAQRVVPVRVCVKGDVLGFEEALVGRSLFGEGVRFVVEYGSPIQYNHD